MKISFFDDEPEIFPFQYGGKARTIVNLATEFAKHPDVDGVTILSRSINSDKQEFILDGVKYVALNDENTIPMIANECINADILNIHCCSFTFPFINSKAKKFYFLHDVLIATADKGSHLDKALGGNFDYILAPSVFAKNVYEENKKILGGDVECLVIPRHINEAKFYPICRDNLFKMEEVPYVLKDVLERYEYILFFPSRPILEKGGMYIEKLALLLLEKNVKACIIGPFDGFSNLPDNCVDTGWIESDKMKYFYSAADVTLNFSTLPESFSQVCIESVFCGTPVVAFDSGNISSLSEIIDAIILSNKDINCIFDNINKAIEMKKNYNKIESERKKIIDNFNVKIIVDKYINLYKRVMEERR